MRESRRGTNFQALCASLSSGEFKLGKRIVRITTARSSTNERDHDAAGFGAELVTVHQQAQHNHRAGDGNYATDADALNQWPGEECAGAHPKPMDRRLPSGAPRCATHLTLNKSGIEKWMPTENIRRITPISAMISKVWISWTLRPGSERAEEQSGEHVANEDRLAEVPSQESADKGCGEDHGDVAVNEGVFHRITILDCSGQVVYHCNGEPMRSGCRNTSAGAQGGQKRVVGARERAAAEGESADGAGGVRIGDADKTQMRIACDGHRGY